MNFLGGKYGLFVAFRVGFEHESDESARMIDVSPGKGTPKPQKKLGSHCQVYLTLCNYFSLTSQ